jgi:orotidine-5'-phosphate decarboxylase
MRNPILVALDVSNGEEALRLVEQLSPVVGGFKVGKELFVREGPALVRRLREEGTRVFLDLKFHDIPNTVARAVEAATDLGVDMLTVHTSGGLRMLSAAERAGLEAAGRVGGEPPLILGVTVLTSLAQDDLVEVGVEGTLGGQVERLARLAMRAGLRGLVCSPLELAFLRTVVPKPCQLVSPGIRATGSAADDQKRTLSAAEALAAGADWLVIGRPITAAVDPRSAAEEILASCELLG